MCGLNCNPGVEVNWWEVHENGSGNDLEATWESCILVSSGWNTNCFLLKRQMNNHFALWLREAMQTAFCLRVAMKKVSAGPHQGCQRLWSSFKEGRQRCSTKTDMVTELSNRRVSLHYDQWLGPRKQNLKEQNENSSQQLPQHVN